MVFRGDNIRDHMGDPGVCGEAGCSASRMGSIKAVDFEARLPGCSGQDADVSPAYTVVQMHEAERDLGIRYIPETWITVPKEIRPPEWDKLDYKDPVVKLKRNLYGHPKAGHPWASACDAAIKRCGFESLESWECLYFHSLFFDCRHCGLADLNHTSIRVSLTWIVEDINPY